jgi:hypothetical protein
MEENRDTGGGNWFISEVGEPQGDAGGEEEGGGEGEGGEERQDALEQERTVGGETGGVTASEGTEEDEKVVMEEYRGFGFRCPLKCDTNEDSNHRKVSLKVAKKQRTNDEYIRSLQEAVPIPSSLLREELAAASQETNTNDFEEKLATASWDPTLAENVIDDYFDIHDVASDPKDIVERLQFLSTQLKTLVEVSAADGEKEITDQDGNDLVQAWKTFMEGVHDCREVRHVLRPADRCTAATQNGHYDP